MAVTTRKFPGNAAYRLGHPHTFKEHALAHEYLDGLKGLEIGAGAHNPFGLEGSLNVAPNELDPEQSAFYRKVQASMNGYYANIDIDAWADDIPVEDDSQDYVISSHMIEHAPDVIKVFGEWNRVVRDGGYVFMIWPKRDALEYDAGRPLTTLEEHVERWINEAQFEDLDSAPDENPRGHVSIMRLEDMLELIDWCNDNLPDFSWEVIDTEETDSKVGNGHTVVCRVSKPVEEDEPELEYEAIESEDEYLEEDE